MKPTHPEIAGPAPACFPPAQWVLWCRSERQLAGAGRIAQEPNGFCSVCTQQYKDRMMSLGKCRHPGVVFVPDEDGDPLGVRPHDEQLTWYNDSPTAKEVA